MYAIWFEIDQNIWGRSRFDSSICYQSFSDCGVDTSREEVWSGLKPDITHMKLFGFNAIVHVPKKRLRKWDEMIFAKYCEDIKGYRFYSLETKELIKSRVVVFTDNKMCSSSENAKIDNLVILDFYNEVNANEGYGQN